jgi:hypothetical protein
LLACSLQPQPAGWLSESALSTPRNSTAAESLPDPAVIRSESNRPSDR